MPKLRKVTQPAVRALAQPTDEAPLAWIAICSSCGQSFISDTPISDEKTAICAVCRATAAWPTPGTDGVFRRPPGVAEHADVPIGQIVRGRFQPRTTFDDVGLKELADSIREHGILNRLKMFINEAGTYELIAGERRWRAAQQLDLPRVPVAVGEQLRAKEQQ